MDSIWNFHALIAVCVEDERDVRLDWSGIRSLNFWMFWGESLGDRGTALLVRTEVDDLTIRGNDTLHRGY